MNSKKDENIEMMFLKEQEDFINSLGLGFDLDDLDCAVEEQQID